MFDGDNTDETITGGAGDDILRGKGGNDTLSGLNGADKVNGGDGNDEIYGGFGWDRMYGGDGDDAIYGGFGFDRIQAGDGDDFVAGGFGDDEIYGGDGNDIIRGGRGDDDIKGGDGDDLISGGAGDDRISGGSGDDTVLYGGSIYDYSWVINGKTVTVTDNSTKNGDSGIDVMTKVETLQFNDATLSLGKATNNAPLLQGEDVSTGENSDVSFDIQATDFDGNALTLDGVAYTGAGRITVDKLASGSVGVVKSGSQRYVLT